MRHLPHLKDLSPADLSDVLDLSAQIKAEPAAFADKLAGRSLAMLFQKTSTRTRVSFEVAMTQLGGHAIYIDWTTSNFVLSGIEYEAAYLSRNVDCIMARLLTHADLLRMIDGSEVPVINGCCEKFHPCQALTDVMTMREHTGKDLTEATIAYIGVQNNVSNSLTVICHKLGINLILATPENDDNGESRDAEVDRLISESAHVSLTHEPTAAVGAADFVYTDTWVDMQYFNNPDYADATASRLEKMAPFQLNHELIGNHDVKIMHDMPIHEGYEITKELVYDERSIIFAQAENRLHAEKGLLVWLLT
jgi:ornithine carbamoyltransferase